MWGDGVWGENMEMVVKMKLGGGIKILGGNQMTKERPQGSDRYMPESEKAKTFWIKRENLITFRIATNTHIAHCISGYIV